MTLFIKIFLDLLPLFIWAFIAQIEADLFAQNKTIDHVKITRLIIVIGSMMFIVAACLWVRSWKDLGYWALLYLAAIIGHFPTFSGLLNYLRKPKRPLFYHNIADTKGSTWDMRINRYYVPIWIGSAVVWLILQCFIFK